MSSINSRTLLKSLRKYDELRLNATDVTRREGSNIDHFTGPDGEDISLCHMVGIFPFTHGDMIPKRPAYEDVAAVALALQHLNAGDGVLVRQVQDLDKRCKLRFTAEFGDTEFGVNGALKQIVQVNKRKAGSQERLPCAFLGTYRSTVTMPSSILSGLFGYPIVSAAATSPALDNAADYPMLARTIPSDAGTAEQIIMYVRNTLNVKYLAVINYNDDFGNAYAEGFRRAAELLAPDMVIRQIPMDGREGSVESAIEALKETKFRYVYGIVYSREDHDALLTEAVRRGVAGNGRYHWMFSSFLHSAVEGRTFAKNSPLHLAYRGSGVLEISGGVPTVARYAQYALQMATLHNPSDLDYIAGLFPIHGHSAENYQPPFVDDGLFLRRLSWNFSPFTYEAAIALGLSACSAYEANETFAGQDHFAHLINTTFAGISGDVEFNSITNSREAKSALYKLINYVEDENDQGEIEMKPVLSWLYEEGAWSQKAAFIYNDGTTDLPPDAVFDVGLADDSNLMAVIMIPVLVVVLLITSVVWYFDRRRRGNELLWRVKREELKFHDPPEVIGRGTFGLVLLGEYRGTQVAVKRVIPPSKGAVRRASGASRRSSRGGSSRSFDSSGTNEDRGIIDDDFGEEKCMWDAVVGDPMQSTTSSDSRKSHFNIGTMSLGGLLLNSSNSDTRSQRRADATMLKKMKQDFVEEMRYLSKLRNPCVTTIMGAVLGPDPMLVMEYMDHGSLYDILHNETMVIEGELILPMLRDITQGLQFLHSATPQILHGDLKAQNILVDSKFRAKVADFGLSQKKNLGGTGTPYWMAPELLRKETANTSASDVYSFGIILYEVYSRRDPYEGEDARIVLKDVADPEVKKRPGVPRHMPSTVVSLMNDCLEDSAEKRPSVEEISMRLKRFDAETADPMQAQNKSKTQSHISLFDIFPRHVAEALRDGHKVDAESFESVTIFFSDIVNFTTISSEMEPRQVASMLDRLYTKLDKLSRKHDIFKVETIGDAYMAVANLAKKQESDHAKRIAAFAFDAIAAANSTFIDEDNPEKGCINIRVGFHSGSVVADVVGTRNPRYCLFGDAVNTAARMESSSKMNRVHCSSAAADLLEKQCPGVVLQCRGEIPVKGKGTMVTYWVEDSEELSTNMEPMMASMSSMSSLNASKVGGFSSGYGSRELLPVIERGSEVDIEAPVESTSA